MTFIVSFSSFYFFPRLGFFFCPKAYDIYCFVLFFQFLMMFGFFVVQKHLFFYCIPNKDTWLLLDCVIVFVISGGSYNILFD